MTCACVIALAALPACSKDETSGTAAPADAGSDAAVVAYDFKALEAYAFDGKWKTEGVVVMRDGQLVYEKYAAGFDATKRHITYSVSKSFGSALVGIAVADGVLKLEDTVCKYVPAPTGADPTYCETTIEHLLQMRSGLKWAEEYEDDPTTSNVLPMLYGDEPDMGAYVALRPRLAKSGEKWSYSSGDSNLLARALRSALAGKNMREWANEKLFKPAKLTSAIFEADRSGTLVFSSSIYLTPQDMARFGQLYLDDGMSGTTRVLSSDWVKYTAKPAPPVAQPTPRTAGGGGSYGAAFWLNAATPTAPVDTLEMPHAPVDMYSAEGHWGQSIHIIPSKKMVVVRVGNDRGPNFDRDPMIAAAVAAVDAATAGGGK
jgi:CubicO group peptidase (beta-lactamase class C family)